MRIKYYKIASNSYNNAEPAERKMYFNFLSISILSKNSNALAIRSGRMIPQGFHFRFKINPSGVPV